MSKKRPVWRGHLSVRQPSVKCSLVCIAPYWCAVAVCESVQSNVYIPCLSFYEWAKFGYSNTCAFSCIYTYVYSIKTSNKADVFAVNILWQQVIYCVRNVYTMYMYVPPCYALCNLVPRPFHVLYIHYIHYMNCPRTRPQLPTLYSVIVLLHMHTPLTYLHYRTSTRGHV